MTSWGVPLTLGVWDSMNQLFPPHLRESISQSDLDVQQISDLWPTD